MAGTVRKRTRTKRNGESTTTWLVDYYDQHGRRHRMTFDTKKAADASLTDIRAAVKAGVHVPDADSITIEQAAALWLRQSELNQVERGSLRVYDQYVRLYIVPLIGRLKLSRLTTPQLVNFSNQLLARTSRTRAKSVVTALRAILAEMQRQGYVLQNVAQPVRVKDNARDERPLGIGVDVPSKAEVQRILERATERQRPRILTAVFTGLRGAELRGLSWSDVDFSRNVLTVNRRADWWGSLGRPKSKNGYREIPLAPVVANTLREWKLACSPPKPGGCDLVFPNPDGGVITHVGLQRGFAAAQITAGVVDARGRAKYAMHALRHFFASWAIEQGFDPKRLQALLGHGSIQMTYDVYGHLFPQPESDRARFAAGERAVLEAVRPVAQKLMGTQYAPLPSNPLEFQ